MTTRPTLSCNHRRRRDGATTVEFALAASILILLIFGGIEITRVSMLRHTVDHAAYLAARHAMIPGVDMQDVEDIALGHLQTIGVHSATVTITPNPIVEDTTSVAVSVDIPVASNSLVIPQFVSGSINGQSRLMTERAPMVMAASLPEPPPPPPAPEPDPPPPDDDDDDDEPVPDPDPGPLPPPSAATTSTTSAASAASAADAVGSRRRRRASVI